MKYLKNTTFLSAIGLATLMLAGQSAMAETNPFGMSDIQGGHVQLADGGKCGDSMKKKGGETKCGDSMKKKADGSKCGDSKKPKEGKCGAAHMKEKGGKCGSSSH